MSSSAEWSSRIDAAAGHRLLDLHGLTDMVEGVLGVRVAGEPDAYLLKTYRTFFDEVRASKLVKVRFDEQPDAGPGRPLNYSSCAQASGVLQARPALNAMLHTHIPAATIVGSLDCGLLPVVQHALIVLDEIVYVGCDIDNDDDAVADIVEQMGDKKIALIQNHGVIVAGSTVAEVVFLTITLEYACRCQLDAQATNAKVKTFDLMTVLEVARRFTGDANNQGAFDGSLQWDGWLRRLDRLDPSYAT